MIVEEKKAEEMMCCGCTALTKCQGSRCMAWRWAPKEPREVFRLAELSTTHGYCGLAGRP